MSCVTLAFWELSPEELEGFSVLSYLKQTNKQTTKQNKKTVNNELRFSLHTLYATIHPKSDALVAIGQFQCKLKTLLASVLYLFYLICLFSDVLALIRICLVVLVDFFYFCVRWSRMEAVAVCV